MDAQLFTIIIAVIYLGLMLGIGYWANTRMKSSKEFLVAGESLGFFVMAIASFSSIQSGWGMIGATQAPPPIGVLAQSWQQRFWPRWASH